MSIRKAILMYFLSVIITLLIIQLVAAELVISQPQSMFNLGDSLQPTVSLKSDVDVSGFVEVTLLCDSHELTYFSSPFDFEAGSRTNVAIPPLTLQEAALGTCSLNVQVKSFDQTTIYEQTSEEFAVSNELTVELDHVSDAKPGSEFSVQGTVSKADGTLLSEGVADVSLGEIVQQISVLSGTLDLSIQIPLSVVAGQSVITIQVSDKHGNKAQLVRDITLLQIPTSISQVVTGETIVPGSLLEVTPSLLDHTDTLIENKPITVTLSNEEGEVSSAAVDSSQRFLYELPLDLAPGLYTITSSFEDIITSNTLTVASQPLLEASSSNNRLTFRNIGNDDFSETLVIEATGGNEVHTITQELSVKKGKTASISLSKYLEPGTFDLILPASVVAADGSQLVSVSVEEHAGFMITGAVVTTVDFVMSKPLLAGSLIGVIIIATVAYWGRGLVKSSIKPKKQSVDEDLSHVFDDFTYEK